MFENVYSVLLAIVAIICIAAIIDFAAMIKTQGWDFVLLVMFGLVVLAISVLGICVLQGWGDPLIIKQLMSWLGLFIAVPILVIIVIALILMLLFKRFRDF